MSTLITSAPRLMHPEAAIRNIAINILCRIDPSHIMELHEEGDSGRPFLGAVTHPFVGPYPTSQADDILETAFGFRDRDSYQLYPSTSGDTKLYKCYISMAIYDPKGYGIKTPEGLKAFRWMRI